MNKTRCLLIFILVAVSILGISRKMRKFELPLETSRSLKEVRVIDGDTFELDGAKIRLHGIDAFEKNQKCYKHGENVDCGALATDYLSFLLTGKNISCNKKFSDRYGRNVSICTVDGIDISKMMVRQGWAKAYTKYSSDYIEDEQFAKDNLLGAWTKDFIEPKDQRGKKAHE